MKVTTTFRHMASDKALRTYVEEKISKIAEKYFHRPQDAVVVLGTEKFRHTAEVTLRADNHALTGKEEMEDMRSAIDLALEKLEKQAEKVRSKYKPRKKGGPEPGAFAVYKGGDEDTDEGSEPRVIKSDPIIPKPMEVDDAVLLLTESSEDFLVFRNSETQNLCVLYRRPDGNFGLIEPEV